VLKALRGAVSDNPNHVVVVPNKRRVSAQARFRTKEPWHDK